jgi:hypothetical protein
VGEGLAGAVSTCREEWLMARTDQIHAETYALEAIQFGLTRTLSRYELSDVAARVEFYDRLGGEMGFQLRACIYGRQYEGQEIRYPATWWDAFKDRFFRGWLGFLLKRFPVRWVVVQAKMRELYPDVKGVPGQRRIVLHYFEPAVLVPREGP